MSYKDRRDRRRTRPVCVNLSGRSLPLGTVYIGRATRRFPASPFANPFMIGRDGAREEVIDKYQEWLKLRPDLVVRARRELRGKDVACWCYPARCHGEVLIRVANSEGDDW